MGLEIERKFLLKNDNWKAQADNGTTIKQGYLNSNKERTVRVRIYGNQGILTIKGKNNNLTRKEFEYEIPLIEAEQMLILAEQPIIEKTRFIVLHGNSTWEIDVFEGENSGLVVAEIELESEQQTFNIPDWIGKEVSEDERYYNANLISNPFKSW